LILVATSRAAIDKSIAFLALKTWGESY
jgi:hypothetical protein